MVEVNRGTAQRSDAAGRVITGPDRGGCVGNVDSGAITASCWVGLIDEQSREQ